MSVIETGLSNYYGEVIVYEEDGKFYMELDDYGTPSMVEISEELYRAFGREFGNK